MTDEQMDARLRRAGETWRAADEVVRPIQLTDGEPLPIAAPAKAGRFRRTALLASAAVVAAALVAGGAVFVANLTSNGKQAAASSLAGTVWRFVGYGDRLDDRSPSTMYIGPDGQLVADDECEVLGAHVDPTGGRLAISAIDERFKGCVDSGAPSFRRGIGLLGSTPSYALDGSGLTVGAGVQAMHFVATPDLPAPTLDVPTFAGADWRLASATDAGGTMTAVSATLGGLRLRVEHGRYTVDEGCNKLSGELTDEGSQAQLKTVTSTTLPCPSPQPYEQVIQSIFQPGAVQTHVLGGQLTVSRAGAGSLQYEWVPSDHGATDSKNLLNNQTGSDWNLISVAGEPAHSGTHMYMSSTREFSITYGCGAVGGTIRVGAGTLSATGIRDRSAVGCSGAVGEQSSTVDSFFASGSALWRVQGRKLIIYSSGAQSFSLVFKNTQPPVPAPQPLAGTQWVLDRALDADKHELPVAGHPILLIDGSNHLTGNDGCNSMSGDVTLDKAVIHFGNGLATTAMACSDKDVTATASRVDAMLSGDVAWSIEGDVLTLSKDRAGVLVYRAVAPSKKSTDPNDLTGGSWNLTTIETGTGLNAAAHPPATAQRLSVAAGGSRNLQFDAGCNYDTATATVGNGTLDVRSPGGTLVLCTGQAKDDETEINAVLSGTVTWAIVGDQLTITKDGVGALVYTRAAGAPQLTGTTWKLSSIEVTGTNSSSGQGSSDMHVTLTLDGTGGFRLEATCGPYVGKVQVATHTVTFSGIASLHPGMRCPYDASTAKTLPVLSGSVQWSFDGAKLTLTKADTTLTFEQ